MKHYCPFYVACPKQRKTLHFLCIVPHRGVAQLVARGIRVPEAGGSSPLTPTKLDIERFLKIETLTRIAKALDVGVDELIK